jgi:hypothetical protein
LFHAPIDTPDSPQSKDPPCESGSGVLILSFLGLEFYYFFGGSFWWNNGLREAVVIGVVFVFEHFFYSSATAIL